MTDINKAIRDVLEEMSNGDGYLCTLGIHADPVIAKIKALVVESMPKNEPHRKDCPANGFTCVCEMWKQNRNQCLGEIRSIWG